MFIVIFASPLLSVNDQVWSKLFDRLKFFQALLGIGFYFTYFFVKKVDMIFFLSNFA